MKKRNLLIVSIFILLVSVGSFQFINHSNKSLATNVDETIVNSADFPLTEDFSEMVNQSELVVIGQYEKFDSTWNMARDINDISKPDSNHYIEGRIYKFKVDKVLQGLTEDDSIDVNLRYSEDIEYLMEDGKAINLENKNPLFIEPEIGKKYMLFLKKGTYYYGALEPFQIQIDENNKAILKSNLINVKPENLKNIQKVGDKEIEIVNEAHEIRDTISGKDIGELLDIINDQK